MKLGFALEVLGDVPIAECSVSPGMRILQSAYTVGIIVGVGLLVSRRRFQQLAVFSVTAVAIGVVVFGLAAPS